MTKNEFKLWLTGYFSGIELEKIHVDTILDMLDQVEKSVAVKTNPVQEDEIDLDDDPYENIVDIIKKINEIPSQPYKPYTEPYDPFKTIPQWPNKIPEVWCGLKEEK